MNRKITSHLQPIAIFGDGLALEANRWMLLNLEKLRALYVRIAVRVSGVESRCINGDINAGCSNIVRIPNDCALYAAEPPAHIGDHHVTNHKLCGGVSGVNLPGSLQNNSPVLQCKGCASPQKGTAISEP